MDELPVSTGTSWSPGPPADGTELTIRQAADRLGVSVSTIRRRIKTGTLVAHKRPGPDGLEYRIPVVALGDPPQRIKIAGENGTIIGIPPFGKQIDRAIERAVADLQLDLRLARQEAELLRSANETLTSTNAALTAALTTALEALPRALPATVVGGGEGASPFEQALAKGPRSWFRRRKATGSDEDRS